MVPPESDDHLHLEIGHVLFIDIVGYSRLLIEEQKERLNQLTEIVLATTPVREATDNNSLGYRPVMGWRWSFTTARKNQPVARWRLPRRSKSTRNFGCEWGFTAGR